MFVLLEQSPTSATIGGNSTRGGPHRYCVFAVEIGRSWWVAMAVDVKRAAWSAVSSVSGQCFRCPQLTMRPGGDEALAVQGFLLFACLGTLSFVVQVEKNGVKTRRPYAAFSVGRHHQINLVTCGVWGSFDCCWGFWEIEKRWLARKAILLDSFGPTVESYVILCYSCFGPTVESNLIDL